MKLNYNNPVLSDKDFVYFRELIYRTAGINISKNKISLIKSRLRKRLTLLDIDSFSSYRKYLSSNNDELVEFINVICTNKTDFFREKKHFEFLSNWIKKKSGIKNLYIWSAACSTGEEPYSIFITINETISVTDTNSKCKILATDLDTGSLATAYTGRYLSNKLITVPDLLKKKYFNKISDDRYMIKDEIKKHIYFRGLNLNKPLPFNKKFDFVFCRNVLIYFNSKKQNEIIGRISNVIKPGGYLFSGHSESLTQICAQYNLNYIQPAIYRKF